MATSKINTNYLHSELKAGSSKLIEQIKEEILERASRIFLWVVLVVEILQKEYDRGRMYALRKRLNEIPDELDKLFMEILTRDNQNPEELILCLQWILFGRRPLNCKELYFAIIAGSDAETLTASMSEEIQEDDMRRFVLNSSKGLAEVTKSKSATVQFIHESVRDYLLAGNGLRQLQLGLESNFLGLSNDRLKQCCLSYIGLHIPMHDSSCESPPSATTDEAANLRQQASEEFPFLAYSVQNVLYHADEANRVGVSQYEFIEKFPLRRWITLNNVLEKYQVRRYTTAASLLYILAEQNLATLIRIELNRVPHMDIFGERHKYPLFAALALRNENALESFLMPDTNTLSDIERSLGPSNCSTAWDCLKATSYILRNKDDFDFKSSLLCQATIRGHAGLVQVLLATRKVNTECQDTYGRAPVHLAASNGHEAVVKLLIDTGKADIDAKDNDRRTPLWAAALNGHEALVKLLIDTGKADIDAKDDFGRTPLWAAALNGHEAVVKLLIGTGKADIEAKDDTGRTPLWIAAKSGRKEVVELLESHGAGGHSNGSN